MMDLRYHVASLMSVFLALTVGIVVGVSLGSSERQAATIQSVQRDVAAIRAEDTRLKAVNAALEQRLAAREDAYRELLPLAIRGRLAGNHVALILAGEDAPSLAAPVADTLRLAGADVILVRLPRDRDGRRGAPPGTGGPGDGIKDPRRQSTGVENGSPSTGSSISRLPPPLSSGDTERTAAALTRALIGGQSSLLDTLRAETPGLEVTGELSAPIRRLLLLCPNSRPEYAQAAAAGDGVEAAVGRTARDAGVLLVAAEPDAGAVQGTVEEGGPDPSHPRQATSLLPALASLGASTVDNVETVAGQIAVVLALAGARGRFGTGPGSARALPPLGGEAGEATLGLKQPSTPASAGLR